jgi:uncharacterized protein (DUF488 family)
VESVSRAGLFSFAASEIEPERSYIKTIFSVGHSTRDIQEFVQLLKAYGIETVVDVRKIAKSRRNPQFNESELSQSLRAQGIAYLRMEGLGGLRHTTKISVNTAWENLSFRGYADYMQTPQFIDSIEQLVKVATETQTVLMCAEAVPWRCHRSLIGDALLIRNIPVVDIMSEKSSRPHKLTPFAHVEGTTIIYPAKTQ